MAIFLNIPTIEGDSLDATHKGWIDIDNLAHSIALPTGPGSRRAASGRSVQSATADVFHLSKAVDLSTIRLQEAVIAGKAFKEAIVEVTRRTSDDDVVFLRYTLGNCAVTQWNLQAAETGVATEQFELAFTQLTTAFTPTSAAGREGSPVDFGWDFAANEPL